MDVLDGEIVRLDVGPYNDPKSYTKVQAGDNIFNLAHNSKDNWIVFKIESGLFTVQVGISNLKLNYNNDITLTLEESVKNGYIEPLVIVSSTSASSKYRKWNKFYDIVGGGSTENSDYATGHIMFKLKNKSELKSIQLTSSKDFNSRGDGISIFEYPNIDLSIEPF